MQAYREVAQSKEQQTKPYTKYALSLVLCRLSCLLADQDLRGESGECLDRHQPSGVGTPEGGGCVSLCLRAEEASHLHHQGREAVRAGYGRRLCCVVRRKYMLMWFCLSGTWRCLAYIISSNILYSETKGRLAG